MRIVVEASAACRPVRTGIARYTIRLVEALLALAHERTGDHLRLALRASRWKHRRHCYRPPGVPVLWAAEPLWPLRVAADVVHGTDSRVLNWRGMVRMATVHDMAVLLFPQLASERFRARMRREWARTAAVADVLTTLSDRARRDYAELFDVPLERIHVVPAGIDDAYLRLPATDAIARTKARHGLDGPYLLYVGELSRRKNVDRMVQGYAACAAARELPLVLAGPDSFGSESLEALIARLGLRQRIRRLGYVTDEELPALYAGAAAFVFATGYEGFGLPVLEAMACGAPVVGSNRGAIPETGGGHALLVDPDEPDSIADGIARALALPQAQRDAARARAVTFTWRRCAEGTRAVYAKATGLA